MKRGVIAVIVALLVLSIFFVSFRLTGKVITFGPSAEEQACMKACASEGCAAGDMECMRKNSDKCMSQCNAEGPKTGEGEKCVEECAKKGCDEFDFVCQSKNQAECDKQCGMIKEPEAKSEEEACIRECVRKVDPELMCQGGEGGEKGNEVCQRCAKECEYLYAGPCLGDEELKSKQKECETCEHCYGEPVMGDSGEGYQCIVNVECKDASSEFGDEPGTGPGIAKAVGDAIGNVVKGIGDFFRGIFGGEENVGVGGESGGGSSGESSS